MSAGKAQWQRKPYLVCLMEFSGSPECYLKQIHSHYTHNTLPGSGTPLQGSDKAICFLAVSCTCYNKTRILRNKIHYFLSFFLPLKYQGRTESGIYLKLGILKIQHISKLGNMSFLVITLSLSIMLPTQEQERTNA